MTARTAGAGAWSFVPRTTTPVRSPTQVEQLAPTDRDLGRHWRAEEHALRNQLHQAQVLVDRLLVRKSGGEPDQQPVDKILQN